MDAKGEFLSLKEEWKQTKGAERAAAEKKIDAFFESLSDDEKKEVQSAVSGDFSAMHKEIAEMNQTLDVREKLAPILPIISVSYIARHFFGKSASWFYQRLNRNRIHGKPVQFSPEEIERLNTAIQDISKQLQTVSL
ncbi:MAG: DUF5053 domain-containing protein [Tannerella sp.]|jgi:hypothetical protein|nr:DUF5053 domain-containing protein [Tannerella sp.]